MKQLSDFVAQGESRKVCRPNKSLYGLKQSPRAWFEQLVSIVRAFGLSRSQKDHYLFRH